MATDTSSARERARSETGGSEGTPTLSVVLPTMDEEEGIEECLTAIEDAIAELGVSAEILVSDSSTDRTPDIAREHGATVLKPDRAGYGYAYRYAFERARGEYVVMGDADTTYDFRELPKLFERAMATDADLVLGSRFAGEIKPGAMPSLHQYLGNPALTAFLNRFYGAGVTDAHSGFRVIRRSMLEALDLETDGMEFASEMIMAASARGYTIEEVPITYHERVGDATLDSFRDGWEHLRFMLVNAPGYLFSVPGGLLTTLGVVVMALAFFDVQLTAPSSGPVWFGIRSMVAGSLLAIVGYQVASLGVFSTLTSDPIRRPSDPTTEWILTHLTLERGLTIGAGLFGLGALYAGSLVLRWLTAGYDALPALTHDILAFTIVVIGIQTVFGSFFVGSVRNRSK
ncbi:glycosyltransferase family 2 protein [Haloarcula amylovorans]|uniref:glycosyltransferase family 2 protein n=1 Tax=Haloarcula amylovorans TaxID=2562280 RepID=UPI001075F2FE|nr:glycosyltransferase family 2 protein [Halomicroarcula amylolytica]